MLAIRFVTVLTIIGIIAKFEVTWIFMKCIICNTINVNGQDELNIKKYIISPSKALKATRPTKNKLLSSTAVIKSKISPESLSMP